MNHIKNYNNFISINEVVGLAKPTIYFVDFLMDEFKIVFTNSQENKEIVYIQNEDYSSDELVEIIETDNWVDLPISSMEVEYAIMKLSDVEFRKRYPNSTRMFNTTGSCYNFADESFDGSYITDPIDNRTESTIHVKLDIGCIICESSNIDSLFVEIEASMYHELNHAYGDWKRISGSNKQSSTDLTNSIDVNRSKIKKEIWKKWYDNIGYYLYWSEPHEVNAMIQEAWPYVKKYNFEEMKKISSSWKNADEMTRFKANDFEDEMINIITQYYSDADPNVILNRLKNGLANELNNRIKSSDILKSIGFDTNLNKPSISGDVIKSMNINKFLKYVEKRVNSSGNYMKRKISKMYSLKN